MAIGNIIGVQVRLVGSGSRGKYFVEEVLNGDEGNLTVITYDVSEEETAVNKAQTLAAVCEVEYLGIV